MFEIHPMPSPLRKQSLIGAEVILRSNAMLIDPAAMPSKDRLLLQQALYDHSVLVVRNQKGIEPDVLPKLAAIWDDQMESTHSGGAKQVKGESSVLSRNNGERIPRAPQVQIIGHGHFKDYEGIKELNLRHVVSLAPQSPYLLFLQRWCHVLFIVLAHLFPFFVEPE